MNTSVITTVGRTIDLNYPTNRAVAIVSFLVMIGAAVIQRLSGVTWIQSALWGAQAGLSVFLAWALCRELDPDHDLSAFVALGLALGGLLVWGLPSLSALFWIILVVRVVNRSVGLPAGILDSLGVVGLGVWLSLEGNWGYGLITALAFLLDAQLPVRTARQLVFALLAALGTATAAILPAILPAIPGELPWEGAPSLRGGVIALAASIVFLPVIVESRCISAQGDRTGERLKPVRVQAAQALALLAGMETALVRSVWAFGSLMPLWAAVIGASLYRFYRASRGWSLLT